MSSANKRTAGRFHYGYLIIIAIIFILAGPTCLVLSCIGIFFTPVANKVGVHPGMASYYVSALFLATLIFLPKAGKLLNKYDARIVVSVAIGFAVLAFLLATQVTELWQWLACGFIAGMGDTVLLFLMTSTLVNRWFARRQGFWIGICFAATGIGAVIWNTVVGACIESYGLETAFLLDAALSAALGFPFSIFVLRSRPEDKGLRPWGIDKIESSDKAEASKRGLDAPEAFKTPSFILIFVMAIANGMCMYGNPMFPSFAKTLELSQALPLLGAVLASVIAGAQLVAKLSLGAIADRNLRVAFLLPAISGLVGLLGWLFLSGNVVTLAVSTVFYGFFTALQTVLLPLFVTNCFGSRDYVNIFSRVSMATSAGDILQSLILGSLASLTGDYTATLALMIVLLIVDIIAALSALSLGRRLHARWH